MGNTIVNGYLDYIMINSYHDTKQYEIIEDKGYITSKNTKSTYKIKTYVN